MARRLAPSINSGSMADIAFLLLIFFLISTTIETDQGISRKLPPLIDDPATADIKEKNLFKVELNQLNQLLVEDHLIKISDLKKAAIAFLDNGGGSGDLYCDYCKGERNLKSSDHPDKAVISLSKSRKTNYAFYIAVQNELVAAYSDLRNREAKRLYGISYIAMKENLKNEQDGNDKRILIARINRVRSMYPERLSEAVTKSRD